AGVLLDIAENAKMHRLVTRALDVAVHDRRSGRDPELVRRLDQFDPRRGWYAAGRDALANAVDENLRRRARQAADARVPQRREVIANRDAGERRAVKHLFRREAVDMQIGEGVFQCAAKLDVMPALHARREARLHADLRRAEVPRLARAP